jgi:hypothetical protein
VPASAVPPIPQSPVTGVPSPWLRGFASVQNGKTVHEDDSEPLVICELCHIRKADVITELIMDNKMRDVNLCATCFVRVHKVKPDDVVTNDR